MIYRIESGVDLCMLEEIREGGEKIGEKFRVEQGMDDGDRSCWGARGSRWGERGVTFLLS